MWSQEEKTAYYLAESMVPGENSGVILISNISAIFVFQPVK